MSELDTPLDDSLGRPTAGAAAIRGSIVSGSAYLTGLALLAGAFVVLTRHLGVTDFGRYTTVIALLSVIAAVADSGLTAIGQRELVQAGEAGTPGLLGTILGIRLTVMPVMVALAVVFAVAVGYSDAMVLGLLIAAAGMMVSNLKVVIAIPRQAGLRFGVIATAGLITDATVVAGIVLLAAAGASLLPFFAVHVAAACAAVTFLILRLGRRVIPRPRFSLAEWRPLIRAALPMGIATAITVVYYRLLLVLCSLIASGYQTGLFATSFRILEFVLGSCAVLVAPFFPILAHAGKHDERRLEYALQRMLEMTVLLAGALVLAVAIAGPTLVRYLAGSQYTEAGPVLQIQSFALIGSLTAMVWYAGLVAVHRQSALVARSLVSLVCALALGAALIPAYGAKGAAVGAVVGETALSIVGLVLLLRARPGLRLRLGFLPRVGLAAAAGAACALIPWPGVVVAAIALGVYAGVALAVRAVPPELFSALRPGRS